MYVRFFCALLCSSFAFTQPSTSWAASPRTISVSGTAVTKVVPDLIRWEIHISSAHKDLVKAKSHSDKQIKDILQAAKSLGIKPKDIQTGYINFRKNYHRRTKTKGETFKDFKVTRSVSITQRNTKKFDKFLTRFVTNTDMAVHYTLDSSKTIETRHSTRLQAITAAKRKASSMAKALGSNIGPVLTIKERGSAPYRPLNASYGRLSEGSLSDRNTGTFSPGAIEIGASVDVVFTLVDK